MYLFAAQSFSRFWLCRNTVNEQMTHLLFRKGLVYQHEKRLQRSPRIFNDNKHRDYRFLYCLYLANAVFGIVSALYEAGQADIRSSSLY